MPNEHELPWIAAAQKGDVRAFERILNAYQNAVYSFVFNATRNELDTEEITQDVFVKAFKNINTFRGDAKLKSWLFSIAHNTTASYYRKKRLKTTSVDHEDSHIQVPDSRLDDAMSSLAVEERTRFMGLALDKMAPQQRQLIQLFYLEELSIKEIQEITHLNEGSIKTGLMRGRNRLHTLLKEILSNEIHSLL